MKQNTTGINPNWLNVFIEPEEEKETYENDDEDDEDVYDNSEDDNITESEDFII